ncbi:hypothetical protein F7725_004389, partial [Dissostichus mawsoni]
MMPWERYVTTYNRDFPPFSERQPQVNQPKSRTEAQAAPSFISPPQTGRETWPIFHHNFYKTSNSVYGSAPSCSLFPASLHPFGSVLGEEAKSRHCVFDPKGKEFSLKHTHTHTHKYCTHVSELSGHFLLTANVLEHQEARDEPQQKLDVLYEEGVIVLSSRVDPSCCEDLLRSVCSEGGLNNLLHLPEASRPIITVKAMHGTLSALIVTSRCKPAPLSSTLTPAHIQPTFRCAEPSRTQPMTEYQSRYSAA